MDALIKKIIKEVKSYDPNANTDLIEKAFLFAKNAHQGQTRHSGEEYITHPLSVVEILMELRPDVATICAALLHDVVEESEHQLIDIKKEFGDEIAQLVEGETKTTKVVFDSAADYTAENWRKILLATTKDVRVILVKLADRLHNMRTLSHIDRADKQKRIAQETLEIYAPIAHKLGLYSIKGELEDLSLRYIKPEMYQLIKQKINEKRASREAKASMIKNMVKEHLQKRDIKIIELSGRAKYFYSIYRKMVLEKKSFEEIYDLIAIRIIVPSVPDCYRVLAEIHQLWKPIPGRFKDYIAVPKSNGYQSLHTDVATPYDVILEVQIRTMEMHHIAKYGVAAHWRYKGTDRDKKFDKRISWLEQVLDWKRKTPNEFMESLKVDLFQDEIVVFSPKGDPVILPEGATPIDFAYEIHSKIGDSVQKAQVNKKLVALDTKLKSGDIVYILTHPQAKPSRNWLSFAVTSKAKQRIRSTLGVEVDTESKKESNHEINLAKYIEVDAKGQVKLSKCCNPQMHEPIVAYKTKDKSITVHKSDCPNIYAIEQNRKVKVKWNVPKKHIRHLNVYIEDKLGMVERILNTLLTAKVHVLRINLKPHKKTILVSLSVKADSKEELDRVVELIKSIKHVSYVAVEKGMP